jgi:hypothetical protein
MMGFGRKDILCRGDVIDVIVNGYDWLEQRWGTFTTMW